MNKKHQTIIFLFLCSFLHFSISAESNLPSITADHSFPDSLRKLIIEKGFSFDLLTQYEFYLLNRKVDIDDELFFLSNAKDSFGKTYCRALLYKKKKDFVKEYNLLVALLNNPPPYYNYYDDYDEYETGNRYRPDNRFGYNLWD